MKTINLDLGELTAPEAVAYLAALMQAFTHVAGRVYTVDGAQGLEALKQTTLQEIKQTYKAKGHYGPGSAKMDAAQFVDLAFETTRRAMSGE